MKRNVGCWSNTHNGLLCATKEGGGHGVGDVDGWQGPCSIAQDQGQSSACK